MSNSTDCTLLTNTILPAMKLTGVTCCDGKFVHCDASGNIIGLRVNSSSATGIIPKEIGQLTQLYTLNLTENQFQPGPLPNLGGLSNLHILSAKKAQLTGGFPSWIASLSGLTYLNLDYNNMHGPYADLSSLTTLETMFIGYNNFAQDSFPNWIFNMPNLQEVILDNSTLPGPVFPRITKLSGLTFFSASFCGITGEITPDIQTLTGMTNLYLDHNQLTGAIPSEIGKLSQLVSLDLSSNHLDPVVPQSIKSLPNYSPNNFFFDGQTPLNSGGSSASNGTSLGNSGDGSSSSGGLKGASLYIVIVVAAAVVLAIAGAAFFLYNSKKKSSTGNQTKPQFQQNQFNSYQQDQAQVGNQLNSTQFVNQPNQPQYSTQAVFPNAANQPQLANQPSSVPVQQGYQYSPQAAQIPSQSPNYSPQQSSVYSQSPQTYGQQYQSPVQSFPPSQYAPQTPPIAQLPIQVNAQYGYTSAPELSPQNNQPRSVPGNNATEPWLK
ncbi:hypothetical protein HDV04_000799 [Boothiomyces sp. JEL0838]|nr:hypothetical protein HDV04_000799 [Boothiomyces sp. JEL0838]